MMAQTTQLRSTNLSIFQSHNRKTSNLPASPTLFLVNLPYMYATNISVFSFFIHSHDCGFHMLMNAEYWDGRTVPHFQEKDIMNIRKISTHKWLSYDENDTDWKDILNLG